MPCIFGKCAGFLRSLVASPIIPQETFSTLANLVGFGAPPSAEEDLPSLSTLCVFSSRHRSAGARFCGFSIPVPYNPCRTVLLRRLFPKVYPGLLTTNANPLCYLNTSTVRAHHRPCQTRSKFLAPVLALAFLLAAIADSRPAKCSQNAGSSRPVRCSLGPGR